MQEQVKEDQADVRFLQNILEEIVDHPRDIKIERSTDMMGVLIVVDLHPDDMRLVIGRAGVTINAIRTLMRIVGSRNRSRVNIKINEPGGGKHYAKNHGETLDEIQDQEEPRSGGEALRKETERADE